MQITNEDKQFIRENLHYIPATGNLIWRDGSKYRPFIGAQVPITPEQVGGKEVLTVSIGDRSFAAADVCWLLWKGRWPKHGIIFADKSTAGKKDLRSENLRMRRKPEYVKKGRAVWVSRQLASQIAESLAAHGDQNLANEIRSLLNKESKR